jgi:hypothetical protein
MPRTTSATTTIMQQPLLVDIHQTNFSSGIGSRTPTVVTRNDCNDDENTFYYEIRTLSKQLFPRTTASVSSPPVLSPKNYPNSISMDSCKVAAQRNVDLLQQSGLLQQERALMLLNKPAATRTTTTSRVLSPLEEENYYLGKDVIVGNTYTKQYTTTTLPPTKKNTYHRFISNTNSIDMNSVVSFYPDPDLLTILDSQSSVTSTSTLLTRNHSQPPPPPRHVSRHTSAFPPPTIVSPEKVQKILKPSNRYHSLQHKKSMSTPHVQSNPNTISTASTNNTQPKEIRMSTMDQPTISTNATKKESSLLALSTSNNVSPSPLHKPQQKKASTQRSDAILPIPWRNDNIKSSNAPKRVSTNDDDAKHATLQPTTKNSPLASAMQKKTEISPRQPTTGTDNRIVTPREDRNSKNYNNKQLSDMYVLPTKVHQPSASYGQSCRPPRASKQEAVLPKFTEEQSSSTKRIVRSRNRRRRSCSPKTTATNIARARTFMNGNSAVRNDHESYTNKLLQLQRKQHKGDIPRNVAKSDKYAIINNKIPPPAIKIKSPPKPTKERDSAKDHNGNSISRNTLMSRASKSGKRNHRRTQSNNGPMYSSKLKNNNPKGMDYLWILTRNGMDTKLFEKLLGRAACWMFNPDGSVGTFSSDGSFMSTSLTSCSPNYNTIMNNNNDDLLLDRSVDASVISTGFMVVTVAAVVIQTLARRVVARFQVLDRMCAVIVCQAYTRFFLHRRQFVLLRDATVQIQSIFRGFVDRFWVKARWYCATKIQSVARTWLTQPLIVQPYRAVLKLQSFYRVYSLRLCLDYYHFYSIEIQRVFRGYAACNRVRRLLSKLWLQQIVQKIIVMQSLVRRRAAKEYITFLRFCTIMIQSFIRTCRAQRNLLIRKTAAVQIQTQWRVYFARLCYQFVLYHIINIQSNLRVVLGRKTITHLVLRRIRNSIHIQTSWRGFLGRRKYSLYLHHVILLQSCIRCFTCKTKRQQMVIERANNATTLQRCWRCFMASICYKFVVYDIITIQSYARLCTSKFKRQELTVQKLNVVRLQKFWRCFIARSCYRFVLYDILTIQFYTKRFLVNVRQQRLRANQVIRLQNWWRSSIARLLYRFVLEDIITMQSFVRQFNCMIKQRQRYFIRAKSAILLQSCWRAFLGRIVYNFVLCDIIAIQSLARLFLYNLNQKRLFSKMNICATLFQTRWRTYLSTILFNASLYVIIIIQACVRRHLSRTCYKFVLLDIVTIQSCARRFICNLYLDKERKITDFFLSQSILYGAATGVQKSWRMHVRRYDYIYKVACVMLIQSVLRGRIIRKAFYSYTEGYRQFNMTSPFRKRHRRSQKDEIFPESRFLRYLLHRKIPLCKEQAISFLRGVPERFKRGILDSKETPDY